MISQLHQLSPVLVQRIKPMSFVCQFSPFCGHWWLKFPIILRSFYILAKVRLAVVDEGGFSFRLSARQLFCLSPKLKVSYCHDDLHSSRPFLSYIEFVTEFIVWLSASRKAGENNAVIPNIWLYCIMILSANWAYNVAITITISCRYICHTTHDLCPHSIDIYHGAAILFLFNTNQRNQTEAGRENSLAPFILYYLPQH